MKPIVSWQVSDEASKAACFFKCLLGHERIGMGLALWTDVVLLPLDSSSKPVWHRTWQPTKRPRRILINHHHHQSALGSPMRAPVHPSRNLSPLDRQPLTRPFPQHHTTPTADISPSMSTAKSRSPLRCYKQVVQWCSDNEAARPSEKENLREGCTEARGDMGMLQSRIDGVVCLTTWTLKIVPTGLGWVGVLRNGVVPGLTVAHTLLTETGGERTGNRVET